MIRRTPVPAGRAATAADAVKVTFVLDDAAHEGPVSVVGDFNDWTPGVHVLRRRSNGTRSISVTMPKGSQVRFRYLGANGHWFDDPEADEHHGDGGILRV